MITLASKFQLDAHLAGLGYEVHQVVAPDGTVSVRYSGGTDNEIQAAIDAYDPLPSARADAVASIKEAADQARRRYASPEKDGIYIIKAQQAQEYLGAVAAGGSELADTTGYEFVVSEQAARQLATVSDAANWILSRRQQWLAIMVAIEDIARPAIEQIRASTAWQDCAQISDAAVAQLEAV